MKTKARLLKIAQRLEDYYGPIPWESEGDPLDVLVLTILSQNTNDVNRDRAYAALTARYKSYDEIVSAPPDELADTIKVGGMHFQKAKRIQSVLREIHDEYGSYTLEHLWEMTRDEVLTELTKYKGIGKKTAGIVLTFSLNKPYFPVDTHITRITKRLEFVKEREDPHDVMNALVPDEPIYPYNIHLIYHGRETCRARKPLCDSCVIREYCPFPTKQT